MDLFYREFGSGKPLIILHGLFGQSDNWVSIGRKLAGHFHVYLPDLRNHGQSPHTAIHSFPAMVDDLYGFIEMHQLFDPILVGHSMGGKVAMGFTLENPGIVNRLAVVDISPRAYPERSVHTRVIARMSEFDFSRYRSRTEIEAALAAIEPEESTRMLILKNLYHRADGSFAWRLNLQAISQNIERIFEAIDQPMHYRKPSLFVRGGLSDYISDEDFPLIRQYFPRSEIVTIAQASHWVHADAPNELLSVLLPFLKG